MEEASAAKGRDVLAETGEPGFVSTSSTPSVSLFIFVAERNSMRMTFYREVIVSMECVHAADE
jgi:hypothetical protein